MKGQWRRGRREAKPSLGSGHGFPRAAGDELAKNTRRPRVARCGRRGRAQRECCRRRVRGRGRRTCRCRRGDRGGDGQGSRRAARVVVVDHVRVRLVVGAAAGRNELVAVVVLVAWGGARVAAVVATAVATGKAPDVLHASSSLTPSACGSWLVTRREITRWSLSSFFLQGAAHASLPSWRPRWRRARLPTCCKPRHR